MNDKANIRLMYLGTPHAFAMDTFQILSGFINVYWQYHIDNNHTHIDKQFLILSILVKSNDMCKILIVTFGSKQSICLYNPLWLKSIQKCPAENEMCPNLTNFRIKVCLKMSIFSRPISVF